MRTTYSARCVYRRRADDTAAWARSLIANPARYRATQHEANLIADLLAQLAGAR